MVTTVCSEYLRWVCLFLSTSVFVGLIEHGCSAGFMMALVAVLCAGLITLVPNFAPQFMPSSSSSAPTSSNGSQQPISNAFLAASASFPNYVGNTTSSLSAQTPHSQGQLHPLLGTSASFNLFHASGTAGVATSAAFTHGNAVGNIPASTHAQVSVAPVGSGNGYSQGDANANGQTAAYVPDCAVSGCGRSCLMNLSPFLYGILGR